MVKVIIAAIALILAGLWYMSKSDDVVDIGGEKHGAEAVHAEQASAASAPVAASAAK